MADKRTLIDGVLVAGVLALGGIAWAQHGQLREFDETIAKMDARIAVARPAFAPSASAPESESDQPATVKGPSGTPAAADRGETPTSDRPEQQPDGKVSAPGTVAAFDTSDPGVRGQLREVIEEERAIEREERWQKRAKHREKRIRSQVNGLAEKTNMDSVVQEQLTDLLVVEQAEVTELFRQARDDFSWPEARDKAGEIRLETDAKAKEMLEDEEYAEYVKTREEEAQQFGGRRRAARSEQSKEAGSDAKR